MRAILGILVISLLGSAALAYGLSAEFLFEIVPTGAPPVPLGSIANSTHILVTESNTPNIQVFDLSGTPADTFTPNMSPRGITMNSTHVVVTSGSQIEFFTLSGGAPVVVTPGSIITPNGITMNSTHILVADTGNNYISILTLSGNDVTTFGGAQLTDATDVAIDSNGRIIVADSVANDIEIFNSSGQSIDTYGGGTLSSPNGVAVDSDNRIIVSDSGNDRVVVFDSSGNILTTFGATGAGDGQFNLPQMLSVDSNNRIIVPDSVNGDVQVFNYVSESSTDVVGGGDSNKHKTAPTSGLDWTTHKQIVTDGFRVNDFIVTVDDNWWTNFPEQRILLMMPNEFEIKTYAQNGGLLVQELCFGLEEVGLLNTAEVCLEAWYDHQQNIVELKVIQETDVIDIAQVKVSTSEKKCSESGDMKCTSTLFYNVKFKEPMRYNIMAIKSIDQSRRSLMPTSLNDGIDLIGVSINPKPTMTIPGPEKYEGLITITQIEKYSNLWISDDGRIFYVNSSGSASIVEKDYTRHRDADVTYIDRNHSEFDKLIAWTQQNAINVFDSSEFQKTDKGFIPPTIDEDGIDHRTETLAKLDAQD